MTTKRFLFLINGGGSLADDSRSDGAENYHHHALLDTSLYRTNGILCCLLPRFQFIGGNMLEKSANENAPRPGPKDPLHGVTTQKTANHQSDRLGWTEFVRMKRAGL